MWWTVWLAARRPAGWPAQRRAWAREPSLAGGPERRPAGGLARHQASCCRARAWAVALGGREPAAAGQRIQVPGLPCPGPSRTAWPRKAWPRPGPRWPGWFLPGHCPPGHCLPGRYRPGLPQVGCFRAGCPRPGWCRQGPRRRGSHRPARRAGGPTRAGSAASRRRCAPVRGGARTSYLLAGVPAAQAHLPCPGPSLNVTVGAVAMARRKFPPVTRHIART